MALKLMLLLVALKLISVTVSYASGNAGGIFGPSLFLGAMLGGSMGTLANHLLPGYGISPGAYALVGMGAVFAGIVRVPMTSVLMIFEMTRDYAVIVPLMIANLTSLYISRRFQKQPIYEALAQQDGIHLPSRGTLQGSSERSVAQVMQRKPEFLSAGIAVKDAIVQIRSGESRIMPVVDKDTFLGMLTIETLECAMVDGRRERPLREIVETVHVPHIHMDHALHVALERMSQYHQDVLPVVNRADIHKLEGVVTLRDVLDSYGVSGAGSEPAEG
jgi:CIC family chloride channel protein